MSDSKVISVLNSVALGTIIGLCLTAVFYTVIVTRKIYAVEWSHNIWKITASAEHAAYDSRLSALERRILVLEEVILTKSDTQPRPVINMQDWQVNRFRDHENRILALEKWRLSRTEPIACH